MDYSDFFHIKKGPFFPSLCGYFVSLTKILCNDAHNSTYEIKTGLYTSVFISYVLLCSNFGASWHKILLHKNKGT